MRGAKNVCRDAERWDGNGGAGATRAPTAKHRELPLLPAAQDEAPQTPPATMEDPTDISKMTGCTFCEIGSLHPPSEPLQPPKPNPMSTSHVILSTPRTIAFLDIFPLSPCHILLCPRRHAEKVTDLTARENADAAGWLPLLARAAAKVSGFPDFNIIQNNGEL